jgi:hypothetical protein
MAEATESLNAHKLALRDILLSQRIEDRDSRTQDGAILCWVDLFGDVDDGFSSQCDELGVPAVAHHAVDGLVLAHLEKAALACFTRAVVAAVPRPANTIADFPGFLGGGDGGDVADDFVALMVLC